MSNNLRITGLATGIDTDSMIKQLMQIEQTKIDKVLQEKQLIQWQQDLYRDIIGDINSFKSSFFDVLKTDSYMLSSNTYSSYEVASSAAKYATASAGAKAVAGTYVLSNVKTATKATQSGNSVKVRQAENQVTFPVDFNRDSIKISITEGEEPDKVTKEYTVNLTKGEYKSLSDLANHINIQLSKAKLDSDDTEVDIFSKLQAKVSDDGTKIEFIKSDANATVKVDNTELNGNTIPSEDFEFGVNIKKGVNDTLIVNIDGTNYRVTLQEGSYKLDANGLIKEINDKLVNAERLDDNGKFDGFEDISDRLQAGLSFDGKNIKFATATNSSSTSSPGNINISGNAVKTLGFNSTNFSVSPTANSKMSSLFNGTVKFEVNGKEIIYDFAGKDKNKTIQNILDDISNQAGVKASYSELSGKFTISSINTGSSEQLNISWDKDDSNSGAFLEKLFNITKTNSTEKTDGSNKYSFSVAGTDASVTIKDPNGNINTVIKPNNTFTIDGVTYSLLQSTSTEDIELTITSNPDKTFKKIVEFIDRYNSLIDKINSKITEKKQYTYKPLTEEQKKDMSDREIELWEEKAKQGLLKGDTYLENMLSKMRAAFFEPVRNLFADNAYDADNIGISLADIGLSTSSDISQRGKIIIDEAKLKEAIQNKGDKIADLFTKKSTTQPNYNADMSAADRNKRYQESGIFQRINDILQDYVRTTRDSNGKKGLLLEKAGIKGDYSELNNLLTEQLTAKEKLISQLQQKFAKQQEKYYLQFAQLEKAMNQLNSQSSWLSMYLGNSAG